MKTIHDIRTEVQSQLFAQADEAVKKSGRCFFKEEIKLHGVRSATVHKISKQYVSELKDLKKEEIFDLCEELLKSGYNEEIFIACDWAYQQRKAYEKTDFKLFDHWLRSYISNWASCDTLCNHTIGAFVMQFPEYINELKNWTKSSDRWIKRAAAVTLIIPARKGMFVNDIFEIADMLLLDKDDLVQKGYGWMLKALSQFDQQAVFDYVVSKKTTMPRTALRYAIEKMPKEMKALAMAK